MFKVGDKVVCLDCSDTCLVLGKIYTVRYMWKSEKTQLIDVGNKTTDYHYRRFKLVLKDNKLNRKLYPNHKIIDEYLVLNVDQNN